MNSDRLLAVCPGLTYRMLDFWCTKNYLHPDAKAHGPGHSRIFSDAEVRVARTMATLVSIGMKPEAAARAARAALSVDAGDIAAVELAPDVYLVLGDIAALVHA